MTPPFKIHSRAEALAPATVANLGPGFDILGMALAEPCDTVIAEPSETPGVEIAAIHGDSGRLPRHAARNTAGIAAMRVLHRLEELGAMPPAGPHQGGVRLTIHKGLPLASGLGSSAASAVAAAVAVNALFGEPLSREDLLPACVEAEALVSGRHADNVGPALLGGILLIAGLEAAAIYRLPVPRDLWLTLVSPDVAVPTAQARAVLPRTVPLAQMVQQTAGLALLVTALHQGDVALVGRAMERDVIVEPARAHLMPGLAQVRSAARDRGAFGTIISGAGPTLCCVCDSQQTAQAVGEAVGEVYASWLHMGATVRVTRPSAEGARANVT